MEGQNISAQEFFGSAPPRLVPNDPAATTPSGLSSMPKIPGSIPASEFFGSAAPQLVPNHPAQVPNITEPSSKNFYQKTENSLTNLGVGLDKGALSTLKGAGTLGSKILTGVSDLYNKITGGKTVPVASDIYNPSTTAGQKAEDFVTPQNTGEKVGKTAEQIAEFFVPAGKVSTLEKVLAGGAKTATSEALLKAGLHPEVAKALSAVISRGVKVGVSTAEGGAVLGLQSGGADAKEGAKTSAIITALMGPLGALGSKVIAPFKSSFNKAASDAFEASGIKPPISAITNKKFLQGAESLASKTVFGQDILDLTQKAALGIQKGSDDLIESITPQKIMSDENIGRTIQQGIEQVKNKSENLVRSTADQIYPLGRPTKEFLGSLAQDDFKKSELSFKDAQNKIFTQFMKDHAGTTIAPGNTRNILTDILRKQGLDSYGGTNRQLKNLFEDLSGETPEIRELRNAGYPEEIIDQARLNKTVPFEKLQAIKESIGQDLIKFDDPDLKRVYGAISQDLSDGVNAADANAGARLQEMNAQYSSGAKALESNLSTSVTKSSPENISSNILSKNSAGAVNAFKARVSPETFKQYSDEFVRNIFDNSVTKEGSIDINKLFENVKKYDPEVAQAWLGKKYEDFQKTLQTMESIQYVRNTSAVKMRQGILDSILKSNPEQVAQNIIKKDSASTLQTIKDTVGEDKFQEISKAFLSTNLQKSVSKSGEFDIVKFKKLLDDFDPETLSKVFSPEQQDTLNAVIKELENNRALRDVFRAGGKIGAGSQTAPLENIAKSIFGIPGRIGAIVGALGSGHFWTAGLLAMSPVLDYGIVKLFTSDFGRKLLTEGFTPANSATLKNLGYLSEAARAAIIEALSKDSEYKQNSS